MVVRNSERPTPNLSSSQKKKVNTKQWETDSTASTEYVVYRAWHAVIMTVIMLLSIVEIGKPVECLGHYLKWPIYLTNWGLTLNVIQALTALVLVYRAHRYLGEDTENPNPTPRFNRLYQVYWCLHSCAVTVSFGVTFMYWVFIYNPKLHSLDVSNFASHLFNSVFMGVDFIIAGHPFELVHAIYPLIFVTAYVAFNYIYYVFGGLSRKGTVTLYEAMDWRNPSSCMTFVGGGYFILTSIHLFLCLCYTMKRRLAIYLKMKHYKREHIALPVNGNTLV